jgi:hypothetical protein
MDVDRPAAEKSTRWNWLLWWRIDENDLAYQVAQYGELTFWESMRCISVAFLVISIVITVAFIAFGAPGFDVSAYFDVALFALLALFIYFGHRWAMVVAMVVWTLEKVLLIVTEPAFIVAQILWWAAYMHAFYFAFRVEQRRHRKQPE